MDFLSVFETEIGIITFRLIVAAILGGIIGVEREYNKHPAGFRTHLLVCVGSCLVMLLAMFGFQDFLIENSEYVNFDPSRLAAYVVSGIGFLGAGTILVQGYTVRGLTTAASIWVVAGIGLSIGVGMYYAGVFTTIIVILSLMFLSKVDNAFTNKKKTSNVLTIIAEPRDQTLLVIIQTLEKYKVIVKKVTVDREKIESDIELLKYQLQVYYPNKEVKLAIFDVLYTIKAVHKVQSF